MPEWWSYRLDSFLLFSPRTYHRLFELYNAALWPLQPLVGAAGLALLAVLWRPGGARSRAAFAALALAWAWVGWAFLWRRYATINWAAVYFAGAFALQALLLAGCAWRPPARGRRRAAAAVLLALALAWPLLGALLGRPWAQSQLAGLAPDPTALATLALLLGHAGGARGALPSWALWPLPLAWCALSGLTLQAMAAPEAALLPAAALVALVALMLRGAAAGHRRAPAAR